MSSTKKADGYRRQNSSKSEKRKHIGQSTSRHRGALLHTVENNGRMDQSLGTDNIHQADFDVVLNYTVFCCSFATIAHIRSLVPSLCYTLKQLHDLNSLRCRAKSNTYYVEDIHCCTDRYVSKDCRLLHLLGNTQQICGVLLSTGHI